MPGDGKTSNGGSRSKIHDKLEEMNKSEARLVLANRSIVTGVVEGCDSHGNVFLSKCFIDGEDVGEGLIRGDAIVKVEKNEP